MSEDPNARPEPDYERSEELISMAGRLRGSRPVPSADFRGRLGRYVREQRPVGCRPPHLRLIVSSYAAAGVLLLLIAALDVIGGSPPSG